MEVEKSAKVYVCKCGLEFDSPGKLRHHKEKYCELILEPKKWVCVVCGDSFSHSEQFYRHQKSSGHYPPPPTPVLESEERILKKRVQIEKLEEIGIETTDPTLKRREFTSHVHWYSEEMKSPVGTFGRLDPTCIKGSPAQRPNFKVDLGLGKGVRLKLTSFTGTGLVRSHNMDYDYCWHDRDLTEDSFLLSNVSGHVSSINQNEFQQFVTLSEVLLMKGYEVSVCCFNEFKPDAQKVGPEQVGRAASVHRTLIVKEDTESDQYYYDNFIFENETKIDVSAENTKAKRDKEDKLGKCRFPIQETMKRVPFRLFTKIPGKCERRHYVLKRPIDSTALQNYRNSFKPKVVNSPVPADTAFPTPEEISDQVKEEIKLLNMNADGNGSLEENLETEKPLSLTFRQVKEIVTGCLQKLPAVVRKRKEVEDSALGNDGEEPPLKKSR